jgi:peptidyl-tRNA hydrolase, PTH2 family
MYAVVRTDIAMTTGKAASQAGHAFLDAFMASLPQNRQAYLSDGGGTKVVLAVDGEQRLRDVYARARAAGLPCSLIIEDDGTATAAGIGPATRGEIRPVTKRLSLMQ